MGISKEHKVHEFIVELLNKGELYTRDYLTKFLNRHLDSFNDFIKNCREGDEEHRSAYNDEHYTIIKFDVGSSDSTGYMLCLNYRWTTLRNGELEEHGCTHGYVDLRNSKLKFFQHGPNVEVNKSHQNWLIEELTREYSFFKLELD